MTYQFADDQDGDGVEDDFDNCAFNSNYDQADADGDQIGDACDNCASAANTVQRDVNLNGVGDACDADADGDHIANERDNCAFIPNPSQANNDGDTEGDICDLDDDNDGLADTQDPCRLVAGGSSGGGACDDDPDQDGLVNEADNCPEVSNAGARDIDVDGVGDACDQDADGDGRENFRDNCAYVANPGQVDADNDGLGDAGNFGSGTGLESCDTKECYVVDRGAYSAMSDGEKTASCLDPTQAFSTRLALAGANTLTGLRTGDVIEVRLFTNRLNAVHTWSAAFDTAPDDSMSTLDNAIGSAATYPGSFQVGADPTYSTIRFKADRAGAYRVRVSTELQGGDLLGLPVSTSTQEIVAEVGEGAGDESGGCASTRAQASLLALVVALGLAAGLRTRRG
ncbi:MAG: thrombospondin type 3 repeat-containing protein [Myxococcota bacterium]